MYNVYLAGAMSGRNLDEVLREREQAKKLLREQGLTFYDPASDEDLNEVSKKGWINNNFNKSRMEWYVKKDLKAVSQCDCVLNITGDLMSDGCAWEMAFAVYARQLPVYIVAPLRKSRKKMGFTNILVDGIFNTVEEAVCHISNKVLENH